jgi:hypothetical protein
MFVAAALKRRRGGFVERGAEMSVRFATAFALFTTPLLFAQKPEVSEKSPGVKVVLQQPASEKLLKSLEKTPNCPAIPQGLIHRASESFAAWLPPGSSLAGSGPYLAALLKRGSEPGYVLRVFEGQELREERLLQPSPELSFSSSPSFVLSRDGEHVALRAKGALVVFAKDKQVGVVPATKTAPHVALDGETLLWCPSPVRTLLELGATGSQSLEALPLCYRSKADPSTEEALFHLEDDWMTLGPSAELSSYQFGVLPRQDGKLWLVNLQSGDVFLTTSKGTKVRNWTFPFRIEPSESEMTNLVEQANEKVREQLKSLEEKNPAALAAGDPQVTVKVSISLVAQLYARKNDLVLLTSARRQPPNLLFWLSEDLKSFRCFSLPSFSAEREAGTSGELRRKIAVTDEVLWIQDPLAYVLWEELLALEEEEVAELP